MAKAGLTGFQQYMLKPSDRESILKRLEVVRQHVYK
jgi:multiple sugar transport system substrate-binding protein